MSKYGVLMPDLLHDAERDGGTILCLDLRSYYIDQVKTELGIEIPHGDEFDRIITEANQREAAVYERRKPCPLQGSCKRHQRSIGKHPYRQLSFMDTQN